MGSAEKLLEAFEDLGVPLEAGKLTDRLLGLCSVHGLDEDKISYEFLAFLSRKKLPITSTPNLQLLESFDQDLAKHLQTNEKVDRRDGRDGEERDCIGNDDEEGAMSFYSGKRQLTPDHADSVSKKRSTSNIPKEDNIVANLAPSRNKFSSRTNAGAVMIRFGSDVPTSSKVWTNSLTSFEVQVKLVSAQHPKGYRSMFERLRDKAGCLDETIYKIGDVLTLKHRLEPQDTFLAIPQSVDVIGRICCDSDGRLNAKSLLLQGSMDQCRGRSLPLDTSHVSSYSLFPGQVVGVKSTNPNGQRLVASEVFSDASPEAAEAKGSITEPLHMVLASGPYTTIDNLNYDPLKDLLEYINKHRPHLVVMCGPFVDVKHPQIDSGNIGDLTFDSVFAQTVKMISDTVADIDTQVIMVPSSRDVHHQFVYPTPPFEPVAPTSKIRMMSDPCVIDVEGVRLGVTSTDILFHLGKEEISHPPRSGDRLRRLALHLIQQRSFYPLHPPSEDINVDTEQLEHLAHFDQLPNTMILPSDLLHFFKEINGCVAINPQRLSRGEGGGVFARLIINPGKEEFYKRVIGEIVRI